MRIRFTSLVVLLASVCMLTSCLSDDNDDNNYTYYKDTAISAFSLGTMNRYLHTTTASGNDSVYKVTYAGSNYKLTIDQLGHRVYNTDSLPYGTDLSHVIATIASVDNGLILLKSTTSDSLAYYSNTDSLDFSVPRTVRIVAQDGQRYADYTVNITARKVPSGTMSWETKATSAELAALDNIRLYSAGNKVLAFGLLNGQTVGYSSNTTDGATWTQLAATLPAGTSIVAKGDSLYALDNGSVMVSADGQAWTTVATNSNLKELIAASSVHLYALTTDGNSNTTGVASSSDNGLTWNTEAIDNDAQLLPDAEVGYACTPLRTNDDIDQVLIVGRCSAANDIYARTWTKLDDYSSHPITSSWSYVDNSGETIEALGEIPSLTVTTYGGYPTALVSTGDSISPLLQSRDGGLTWKNSGRALPDGINASLGKLGMTSDSEGSLWIVANGVVWKN